MAIDTDAPHRPAGHSPLRRPGSVRRTSSIDMSWPEGIGKPMRMRGHARDIFTPRDGSPPRIVGEDRMDVLATARREILAIESSPPHRQIAGLVGARGGGSLRGEIDRLLPDERERGTPLCLLLDDLSGASLVAPWAWSQWIVDWADQIQAKSGPSTAGRNGQMEGICIGFKPGSKALASDGTVALNKQNSVPVVPLPHPDDQQGWHELPEQVGVGMRRARRIDIWFDDVIHIDAAFQDSSTSPQGGRAAVHEYVLHATADPMTLKVLSLSADPRVLPYPECPGASANVSRMEGVELTEMRTRVLKELSGTAGCTHLNDALRGFADIPQLVALLKNADGRPVRHPDFRLTSES